MRIEVGDRVFFLRQGVDLPGLIGAGWVKRGSYVGKRWDPRSKKRKAVYVDIQWDGVVSVEDRIPREELLSGILPQSQVKSRQSGIEIEALVAKKLEKVWAAHLKKIGLRKQPVSQQPGAQINSRGQDTERDDDDESQAGGFGNSAENRKVERRAVRLVTDWYKRNGWTVDSVEAKNLGYDLSCTKDGTEEKVEVKGVKGVGLGFIITAGECAAASKLRTFVLCVVTSALSKKPKITAWRQKEVLKAFNFKPIQFKATLRKKGPSGTSL